VLAIEIKAGQTYTKDYLKNLKNFPLREAEKWLIYSGEQSFDVSGMSILGW
jgi:hypothetical protein